MTPTPQFRVERGLGKMPLTQEGSWYNFSQEWKISGENDLVVQSSQQTKATVVFCLGFATVIRFVKSQQNFSKSL